MSKFSKDDIDKMLENFKYNDFTILDDFDYGNGYRLTIISDFYYNEVLMIFRLGREGKLMQECKDYFIELLKTENGLESYLNKEFFWNTETLQSEDEEND